MSFGGVADFLGTGNFGEEDKEQEDTPIFDKHNDMLHGHSKSYDVIVM